MEDSTELCNILRNDDPNLHEVAIGDDNLVQDDSWEEVVDALRANTQVNSIRVFLGCLSSELIKSLVSLLRQNKVIFEVALLSSVSDPYIRLLFRLMNHSGDNCFHFDALWIFHSDPRDEGSLNDAAHELRRFLTNNSHLKEFFVSNDRASFFQILCVDIRQSQMKSLGIGFGHDEGVMWHVAQLVRGDQFEQSFLDFSNDLQLPLMAGAIGETTELRRAHFQICDGVTQESCCNFLEQLPPQAMNLMSKIQISWELETFSAVLKVLVNILCRKPEPLEHLIIQTVTITTPVTPNDLLILGSALQNVRELTLGKISAGDGTGHAPDALRQMFGKNESSIEDLSFANRTLTIQEHAGLGRDIETMKGLRTLFFMDEMNNDCMVALLEGIKLCESLSDVWSTEKTWENMDASTKHRLFFYLRLHDIEHKRLLRKDLYHFGHV